MRRGAVALALAAALSGLACADDAPPLSPVPRELSPVPNPFGPADPLWSRPPRRERPGAIAYDAARDRLYVTLLGTETTPMREVAVVDARSLDTIRRVQVGPGPIALALHPDGDLLFVANRFARYVSVVGLRSLRVVAEVDAPFYTEAIAFSPDGRHAFLGNRWKDSVLRWEVDARGEDVTVRPIDEVRSPYDGAGIPVPKNPRRVSVTPDGGAVLVTSETELALTMLDAATGDVIAQHRPRSPVIDATVVGDFVYVLHTGSGTFHPPDDGFDGDADGRPGDGTANVVFQDLQNELDVLALADLSLRHRYTSDSICCRDYRDVDPDHPDAGAALEPVDRWPASRVAFLPPRETWIVAGALPERAVEIRRDDGRAALAVLFAGSSEVQTFDADASTGALAPRETAGGLYRTGYGSSDAVATDAGRRLVVVDRLGESLTAIDLLAPATASVQRAVVGDVTDGAFPASDAELGEAFNTMTAAFTVDGDQTCVHCHRDGTPIAKPISMPLLAAVAWGTRLPLSYRAGYDGRPWFLEGAMDEENFFAVINEFARKENFCCEGTDPRIWPRYPTRDACSADPALPGCNHVLDCVNDPPPECATRAYGAAALTRDRHFRDAAVRVFGRDTSFGDGLYQERIGPDGAIERRPIPLGFDAITRALGLFLLAEPRILPNPNAAYAGAEVEVGRAIYESSETGCATCHPLPVGATARATVATSAPGPILFPYVVSPSRHPGTGADVDRLTPGFLQTFPDAAQTDFGLRVGVTSVRGAWDRALFLHHGRARSLREVVMTPGHPALGPGETGFNERDGQENTHGGTSHLGPEEIDALVRFLETL